MAERYTPEMITTLDKNEIFVFGSNLAGHHAGGAARIARQRFGAIMGQGVGLQGQSYAIPTMQGGVGTIKPFVDQFISFAKTNPSLTFYVTRIGCGIAGFTDNEIAPLFKDAQKTENIILPKSFYAIISKKGESTDNLERFLAGQQTAFADYKTALNEIMDGHKRSHWIWYIFPQLRGLGRSKISKHYGIINRLEAEQYLKHPILGHRLREITEALLSHQGRSPESILGFIDAIKVKSCMTLFDCISPDDVFGAVLDTFYNGERDSLSII